MKKVIIIFPFIFFGFLGNAQFSPKNLISSSLSGLDEIKSCDLDGDGDMDVLSASSLDNTIAWYENLGGGNFGFQKIINGSVQIASSVFAEDLDGDGDLDVLTASKQSWSIAWHENLSGGNFGPEQIISSSLAQQPKEVIACDLDGDGDKDVLSASLLDNKIAWYENLGGGSFGPQQIITTIAYDVNSIYSIDLDGDFDLDVLSASPYDDKIAWYENLGGGLFGAQQVIFDSADRVMSVYAEDMDGDGDMDVLSASGNDHTVAWYENLGGGVIDTLQTVISANIYQASSVIAKDMDNDGDADVITGSQGSEICWFENINGGGVDTVKNIISTSVDGEIVTADDIDGDGNIDVIHGSWYGGKVVWNRNLGGGVFGPDQHIHFSVNDPDWIYATDLDLDGDQDILSVSSWSRNVIWHENIGAGKFDMHENIISNEEVFKAMVTDLDGDLDFDIVTYSLMYKKLSWYENTGNGSFTSEQIFSNSVEGALSLDVGDIDGDGDNDILIGLHMIDSVVWFENLGSGIIDTMMNGVSNNLTNIRNAIFVDVDGDFDNDIVTVSNYGPQFTRISWYENLGTGIIDTNQNIISNMSIGFQLISRDLDGDMDFDLISVNPGFGGKLGWFENLGGGIYDTTQKYFDQNGPLCETYYVDDMDFDGDMDAVSIKTVFGEVTMYENDGMGLFSSYQIEFLNMASPSSIFTSDLDGDGDKDVITALKDYDEIGWYENYDVNSRIKGKNYFDNNQNGILDTGDIGLGYIQEQVSPTFSYSFSDNLGDYFFIVDSGDYIVSYVPLQHWSLTSDSSSYNVSITGFNQVRDSLDFGFYPDTIFTQIKPDLTGGLPRCNQVVNYWVNVQNEGTTMPDGIIHLQLDDSLGYVGSALTPDSIIGQNIYWYYDSLFFYASEIINLQVQMPPFTSMGDTVISYLTVHELDTLNNVIYSNIDTLKQVVVCAYDPNDKSVDPKGIGLEGYIGANQELEYLIRFQNTGNDTALTVMVRDQLDDDLNWSSLQPIASSHAMQSWIEQDGEVVFKFENIMLPDSGVDFVGSQGFVKFIISPKAGLSPNTPIYNESHIHFDFNSPVITNTTLNTIECSGTPLPAISFNWPYLETGIIGNCTYQWFLNGSIISGANSDTLIPMVNGNYTVELTDSNNCTEISQVYVYLSVDLVDLIEIKSIVFPNPFTESTTILFEKNLNEEYDLLVFDVVGKEKQRFNKISGNRVVIHQNDVGKGLFLAFLVNNRTGEKIFIEKLVVQ